ncbi:MAG: DUF3486 family protein [Kangiella sp.]|nr:DUF3486 family protein [Kangiella sp.]MCW9029246.1 DUF3486 family protein [Kangiella sp.]
MSRSSVDTLPSEIKAWLDQQLSRNNFSNYDELTEQLNAKLEQYELELSISRSSLGRYGKKIKHRMQDMRKSAEIAKLMATAMGDDEDAMSQATVSLAQDTIFQMMIDIRDAMDEKDGTKVSPKQMSELARAVGNLARASLPVKKYAKQVREKAEAAADAVSKKLNKQGLTKSTVDDIKREILGIGRE